MPCLRSQHLSCCRKILQEEAWLPADRLQHKPKSSEAGTPRGTHHAGALIAFSISSSLGVLSLSLRPVVLAQVMIRPCLIGLAFLFASVLVLLPRLQLGLARQVTQLLYLWVVQQDYTHPFTLACRPGWWKKRKKHYLVADGPSFFCKSTALKCVYKYPRHPPCSKCHHLLNSNFRIPFSLRSFRTHRVP